MRIERITIAKHFNELMPEKTRKLKPSCSNVSSLTYSMSIFLVSLFAFSIISAILYYSEQPAAAQATSTQESFKGFDHYVLGWYIEVPSNWIGPAFLNPEQSIVYWISDHGKIGVTISMYLSRGYSVDHFANEKVRLVSSWGLPFLVSHQGYFGTIPGYQLGFNGYTNILVVNNGMVYDIGLYHDAESFPTLSKVRDSIRIYNPQTTQSLDILANNIGSEGMDRSQDTMRNSLNSLNPYDEDYMRSCDQACIDAKEYMRTDDQADIDQREYMRSED
jgi:hypothetical protein